MVNRLVKMPCETGLLFNQKIIHKQLPPHINRNDLRRLFEIRRKRQSLRQVRETWRPFIGQFNPVVKPLASEAGQRQQKEK